MAPYTDGGRLTEEGRAFLSAWLARWPVGCHLLLRKAHPGFYTSAVERLGVEEVNADCEEGAVKALRRWDPAIAGEFGTYAVWKMRSEVQQSLRRLGHLRYREWLPCPEWVTEDIPARVADDRTAGLVDAVEGALEKDTRLTPRARELVRLRMDDPGLTYGEIGSRFGLTKQLASQSSQRTLKRIRNRVAVSMGVDCA